MNVFSFTPANESLIVRPADESNFSIIYDNLSKGNFENISGDKFELVVDKKELLENLPDIPSMYPEGVLCRMRAYEALKGLLKGCGEWNPMTLYGETLYYFSVTRTLDILDISHTKFIEFDNVILGVKDYAFKNIDCKGYPIFRMERINGHYPVVTQEFVDKIQSENLSGLKFKQLGAVT